MNVQWRKCDACGAVCDSEKLPRGWIRIVPNAVDNEVQIIKNKPVALIKVETLPLDFCNTDCVAKFFS
jgi:hypothetical protein